MTIEFLQSASNVCFAIAIGFAILAAALFFLLDIWENFLIETDRAQRKTIDEMHERNRATGKLRADDSNSEPVKEKDKPSKVATKPVTAAGKTLKAEMLVESQPVSDLLMENGQKSGNERHAFSGPIPSEERFQRQGGYGSSTVDFDSSRKKHSSSFRVVQRTIIVHTDEMITI